MPKPPKEDDESLLIPDTQFFALFKKKWIYFLLVKGAMLKSQENQVAYPQQQIQPGTREMEMCHGD